MAFSLLIVKKICPCKGGGSGERVKLTTPKIPIPSQTKEKKKKRIKKVIIL
jgi:hypothetical protein